MEMLNSAGATAPIALPFASRSVTVTVDAVVPSAITLAGDAVTTAVFTGSVRFEELDGEIGTASNEGGHY